MSKPKTAMSRLVTISVAAAALSAAGIVALASPAQAAPLGTLTISPSSGTVSQNPMFTSATTSAACPTGYGTNATLGVRPVGGTVSPLRPIGSDANYDQAPFSLAPTRSMAAALFGPAGGTVAPGKYEVVVLCTGELLGDNPDLFITPITVTGTTWSTGSVAATPTTTNLNVAPPSPVVQGTSVTLTASVSPAAAGTVEFFRGAISLGSAPVSGGTASLPVTTLPVGSFGLTASFTATDPAAFGPSTSAAFPYQITAPAGTITATQQITASIAPGAFSLTAGATAILTGGTVGGQATGPLPSAQVVDLRGSSAGWTLQGVVGDFTGPSTIPANNLGWAPAATKSSGSGTVITGATVAAVAPGISTAKTLCSAAGGTSAGTFDCGAALTLKIPDTAAPGGYAATLTLTLA